MNELTFILILAGIAVVLLVAMFTYYKHHKKIHDEIENFNHHNNDIDDVLLSSKNAVKTGIPPVLNETDLPHSFNASRQDDFDINQVHIQHENSQQKDINQEISHPEISLTDTDNGDKGELVDGVYLNSKRVISTTTDQTRQEHKPENNSDNNKRETQVTTQQIKVVYEPLLDGVKDLIISHTIITKGEFFTLADIIQVLQNAGLSHGEMNIFHFPADDKPQTSALFSIANIIEPGIFDLNASDLNTLKTPGISLFIRLPVCGDNHQAYETFIHTAKKIATDLGGELCDETRNPLTQQAISYKKELISKLNFDITKAQKLADMGH